MTTSAHTLLQILGVPPALFNNGTLVARSPIDGSTTGRVQATSAEQTRAAIGTAQSAFFAGRWGHAGRWGQVAGSLGSSLATCLPAFAVRLRAR